jgi:fatty acid desaturase
MLTDWERRQLDEIERGLIEDFPARRRLLLRRRHALAAAALLAFAALLFAIGAWVPAAALSAVSVLYTGRLIALRARRARTTRP